MKFLAITLTTDLLRKPFKAQRKRYTTVISEKHLTWFFLQDVHQARSHRWLSVDDAAPKNVRKLRSLEQPLYTTLGDAHSFLYKLSF